MMPRNALVNSMSQIHDILHYVANLSSESAELLFIEKNVGKHIRHVSDHILAFIQCLDTNVLDYNLRNRNSPIETDWRAADHHIQDILHKISAMNDDNKDIQVISEIGFSDTAHATFQSNLHREMLYLINHTIHHAAYIALVAKGCGLQLPDHIGIAPATATHMRNESAA